MMRGSRFRTIGCLFLLVIMAVVARSQGTVVALKRTDGLAVGGAIDARFNGAPVVTTTVGDNSICMHQNARWMGAGKNTISGSAPDGATYVLFKFDVSAVPACSQINLAQLRLYTAGTGCASAATVLTHDWREGPGTGVYGTFPGAAGGVSYAHPIGYQTAAHRNASNGTTPPEASWGLTSDQFFNFGVDAGSSVSASANQGGYYVINVTSHVQAWVSGAKPNYGWALAAGSSKYYMSENTSDLQPVLFIDYSPAADGTPPAAATDLAASNPTSETLVLTWTAPGDDGNTGTATSYDIRYSTSANIAANWGAAKQLSNEPLPLEAGTVQSVIVTGLVANTTYYFAMKALDEVPNGSTLAAASGTTLPDITPPAAVADLAVTNYTSDTITLRWTAPGDDGTTGTAASYDIRYSTSPINNDTDWTNATQATGEPASLVSGTVQSMVITGLAYDTTYYLATKTIDEVGNISALSNVATQKTLQDPTSPAAVADLAIIKAKSTTLTLSWTAPGDDGASGKATSYDIRYSRDPITDANWDAATQVPSEPAPRDAGKHHSMIVYGLVPSATYYFALKTSDEVPNVSAMSNVATGQTLVNTPINKQLLCKDDFEYRGAFALPETVDGAPAGDPSGIAVRQVNGQLRILTGYSSAWGNPVVEVAVPDPSTWKTQWPWPQASLICNWGRSVYGTNTEPYYGNPPSQLNDGWWGHGMTFDPATNRFYFSWGYWYNVGATNNDCLGWADLTVQGAPVVHGPWKDNAGTAISQRIRGGTTIIPSWFADAYLGGRNLGLGFGGPWSGLPSCSIGPYLTAAHHPGDDTNGLDTLQLLYYPYSPMHFCTRDANYVALDSISIPPVGDVGYWTDVDNIWGGGCWIDLPDKQGMMYFVWWAHGNIAYIDGNPKADWSEPTWMVYDPADLALVAQGQMNSWAPGHDDWPMPYTPSPRLEYGYSMTDGVAFDAQTRTLFVKQKMSYQSGGAWFPLIHAWHIKESPLPRLIGDINNDGYVNVGDLQLLVAAWGSQAGPPPTAGWNADTDINMDGYVNVGDLQLLVAHWGQSLP